MRNIALAGALLNRARKLSATKAVLFCVCVAVLILGLRRPSRFNPHAKLTPGVNAVSAPDGPPAIMPADSAATTPVSNASSTLDLEIDHPFKDGKISVWVDGKLEYTHALHGAEKKHLLVFHKARGRLSQKLAIHPGPRRVRVQAQSQAEDYDQRREVTRSFSPGRQRTLRISFDGPHEGLRVRVQ